MCLAVPVKITSIEGDFGTCEIGGVRRRIGLHLIDDVQVGDYVLLHAGFAISKINKEEALETLRALDEAYSLFKGGG
ncbi:MAG: HypC/HybG/HupF family hydrogenase formation chaperone [bacterium]